MTSPKVEAPSDLRALLKRWQQAYNAMDGDGVIHEDMRKLRQDTHAALSLRPPVAPVSLTDEREAFEAWYCENMDLSLDPIGNRTFTLMWKAAIAAYGRGAALSPVTPAGTGDEAMEAARYRFLASEAYECIVPHGNKVDGSRTAWITKLHAGKSFAEAIDAAMRAQTKDQS